MIRIEPVHVDAKTHYEWTSIPGVPYDIELRDWCQAQNSQGQFFFHPMNGGWFFEHEQDALLFKLKWGSYKKKNIWGFDADINSMYPHQQEGIVIKVMKNRYGSKREFEQEYMCTFDVQSPPEFVKHKGKFPIITATQKK
jgi:hypothetical protein